jgi:hypothetical protein
MNEATAAQEIELLARRMIWWKAPEETLRQPRRLLAQVMALGTWEDVQLAKRSWRHHDFVAVLNDPPPGLFDRRSWAYWRRVLRIGPGPPLLERRLP